MSLHVLFLPCLPCLLFLPYPPVSAWLPASALESTLVSLLSPVLVWASAWLLHWRISHDTERHPMLPHRRSIQLHSKEGNCWTTRPNTRGKCDGYHTATYMNSLFLHSKYVWDLSTPVRGIFQSRKLCMLMWISPDIERHPMLPHRPSIQLEATEGNCWTTRLSIHNKCYGYHTMPCMSFLCLPSSCTWDLFPPT